MPENNLARKNFSSIFRPKVILKTTLLTRVESNIYEKAKTKMEISRWFEQTAKPFLTLHPHNIVLIRISCGDTP